MKKNIITTALIIFTSQISFGQTQDEITQFQANQTANGVVRIDIETCNEYDRNDYIIERSEDGQMWELVEGQFIIGPRIYGNRFYIIDRKVKKEGVHYRLVKISDGLHKEIVSTQTKPLNVLAETN